MIAKDSGTGKSFAGLANYLENGHKGDKQDRVAWFDAVNMDIGSLREGAQVMKEAANENSRVEKPVYHFSINWHPDESDQVDKSLGIEIAREALKDLGLEDHQAMIVAHKDTDHFHVHVVANRINPETEKAWTGSFSKMKLEESMARLSLEHGFEVVPGYHNAKDLGIEAPAPDVSQSSEALRFEQRTDSPSFDTQVKIQLPEVFEKSNSWDELHEGLDALGYQIQPRARGLVVVDQEGHFAKASSIGREFSKASLEAKFEEKYRGRGEEPVQPEPEGRKPEAELELKRSSPEEIVADALDNAVRNLEAYDQKAAYARDLFIERQEVLSRTEESYQKYSVMRDARKNVERSFGEVYADPDSAIRAFTKERHKYGIEQAVKNISDRPKNFGELKHGRMERFMSSFVENNVLKDIAVLKENLKPYQIAVADIDKDRERFKADLSERFDKTATKALKEAQDDLRSTTRPKLEKAILAEAEKIKTTDLNKLPFNSELRREAIKEKIAQVRGDDQDKKWARGQGQTVDRSFKRFPSMPANLSTDDKRAWLAVDAYAKARHEIETSSVWMKDGTNKGPEMFKRLRETAEHVVNQGAKAERHFSRFKVDKKVLYASTVSGVEAQKGKNRVLPFVRSKSPNIQIKLTTILRMIGIPIPRLPKPRIPRPKVPLSRRHGPDRGLGRELNR